MTTKNGTYLRTWTQNASTRARGLKILLSMEGVHSHRHLHRKRAPLAHLALHTNANQRAELLTQHVQPSQWAAVSAYCPGIGVMS